MQVTFKFIDTTDHSWVARHVPGEVVEINQHMFDAMGAREQAFLMRHEYVHATLTRPRLFLDEFAVVAPEVQAAMVDIASRRPTVGKSKALKKSIKRLNKQRKKQGLKKLKVKDIKLKTPKGWNLIGFPAPGVPGKGNSGKL